MSSRYHHPPSRYRQHPSPYKDSTDYGKKRGHNIFRPRGVRERRDANSNLAFLAFVMALLDTVVNIVSTINSNNNNNNNNNNDNNNNNNNANINDLIANSENTNDNMVMGKSMWQRAARYLGQVLNVVTSPITHLVNSMATTEDHKSSSKVTTKGKQDVNSRMEKKR
ncbi:hypothetical protein Pcinc_010036 [Petrolisthes cinctipes]|uniref:Uncharacterized protein n=1 Tax=Petrolisthes cinctipes TaxID=88211 RepID=A0AAE1G5K7_PETCI|nr:hypothetical protein Pcinc_010036 [Petrolisthes cinctipes]